MGYYLFLNTIFFSEVLMKAKEIKVLVVDDMSAMRMRIVNQLKQMGFQDIFEAEDGEAAFKLVQKMHDENNSLQLILSDWNMPKVSGLEFLIKIRSTEIFKEIPFLMITAEGEKDQVIKAIKAGVSDYLIKPVTQILLKEKLCNFVSDIK